MKACLLLAFAAAASAARVGCFKDQNGWHVEGMKPVCNCGQGNDPHDCADCGDDDYQCNEGFEGECRYRDYKSMTLSRCRSLCPSYTKYVGLEYHGECYCSYVPLHCII